MEFEITKANKLIAEFMGVGYQMLKTATGEKPYTMGSDHGGYKELQYHISWDWLMPVVEKICLMSRENYLRTFGMCDEHEDFIMVRFNLCALHSAPTLIEATYNAVVDYIKRTTSPTSPNPH